MGLLIFSAIAITLLAIALKCNIKKLRRDFCSKAENRVRFSSLPSHYSYFFVLWSLIFTFVVNLTSFPQPAKFVILVTLIVTIFALTKFFFRKNFNAKKQIEKLGTLALSFTAGIGIIITIAVTLSILFESIRFFGFVKLQNFLFGLEWNPQMASAEPESLQKAFGIIPVFTGTLLITLVAMIVAIPLGITGATYLCFYAKAKTRDYLKPILEILAGIPTVVYGYFAVIAVAPFFKHFFNSMGIEIASESALAAGFVMGVMIIPFVLSLSDDAINSVPQALKDGALAMGSTKSEMIKKVALPAAMPSIVGAVILAVSRAIGETMIVVMAAGLIAKLTLNPLAASTTATVQIVTLLVGDQEFNSPKTLAAFALALTLFIFTFALNIVALAVIKNYKKTRGLMLKEIVNLKKRNAAETRFKLLGMASVGFALCFLVLLFAMIFGRGTSAFWQNQMALKVDLSQQTSASELDYRAIVKNALRQKFPQAQEISKINSLYQLISKISNIELKKQIARKPQLLGTEAVLWFTVSSKADMYFKHDNASGLNEQQLSWLNQLKEEKQIRRTFNWNFFHFADSREAEIAGIGAGLVGSFLTMLIFLIFAFPIGVMCAFYLEEFAAKNFITDAIEISINNLAAIPSIIYGLLGLTIYLQFMNLPRSSSLVGGMTLFMLVLPVVIIATRNTIRAIPNTIRDGAAALGASKMQVTLHHLLPLSVPGIMTGTILAISRALGETAPLLMIGMVAFIADVPGNFSDPTSVLPVQIYLWSDSPEAGFAEKCAAAIIVLLGFLIVLNLFAVVIRKKFERKW